MCAETETTGHEITESEITAAEKLDAGLVALAADVRPADITSAFGGQAAELAGLADQLVEGGLSLGPEPEHGFITSLEAELVDTFESRPVRWAWLVPSSGLGRVTELAVVGVLAAAIAIGAFLMGAGSLIDGSPTSVPTANAETSTATATTPEANYGSSAFQPRRLARTDEEQRGSNWPASIDEEDSRGGSDLHGPQRLQRPQRPPQVATPEVTQLSDCAPRRYRSLHDYTGSSRARRS
jgi:hypothetical protein